MNDVCIVVREEITELLLLDRALPAPLARHLKSCAGCSAEAKGVRRVIRTFERADACPAPVEMPRPKRASSARAGQLLSRAHRRVAVGITCMALAACAAAGTVAATSSDDPASVVAVRVAQDGAMVSHPWGTEIPVSLSGLRAGSTYRLMTGNARGERVQAGSVKVSARTDGPLRLRMTTAMHKSTITTLYVQDADGQFVGHASAGPSHRT